LIAKVLWQTAACVHGVDWFTGFYNQPAATWHLYGVHLLQALKFLYRFV